jgi:hypothetical protein
MNIPKKTSSSAWHLNNTDQQKTPGAMLKAIKHRNEFCIAQSKREGYLTNRKPRIELYPGLLSFRSGHPSASSLRAQ